MGQHDRMHPVVGVGGHDEQENNQAGEWKHGGADDFKEYKMEERIFYMQMEEFSTCCDLILFDMRIVWWMVNFVVNSVIVRNLIGLHDWKGTRMYMITKLALVFVLIVFIVLPERIYQEDKTFIFVSGSPLANIHASSYQETTRKIYASCLPDDGTSSRCSSVSPRITLIENNWLASSINNALARIILEEKLGVCVDILQLNIVESLTLMENSGATSPIVLLEYWKLSNFENYKKYVLNGKHITDVGDLGPSGQIGWFVPNFMRDAVQNNYRYFRLSNMTRMVSGSKTWINYDEQIIKNLKLNLQLEYASDNNTETDLIENLQNAQQQRKDLVAYFWYPHQLFSRPNPPSRVFLPQFTDSCHTSHNIANGLVDCDYPLSTFSKLQTSAVTSLPTNVQRFLTNLNYKGRDQVSMMGNFAYNSMSLADAACTWLTNVNNTAKWKAWIAEPVVPIQNRNEFIISVSVVSFTAAILLAGIFVFLVWWFVRKNSIRKRENRLAPKVAPICIVFTHIQNASLLWTLDSDLMKKVLVIHHKIVRENIRKFKGYEVKTQSDSFMMAFNDPVDALGCCFAIQNALLKGAWTPEMLEFPDLKEVKWNNEIIYKGPRVRMGVHFGRDVEAHFDPTTKRFDYFGTTVNQAARTESKSHGGRVYVSSEVQSFIKHRTTALSSTNSLPKDIPFIPTTLKDELEEFKELVSDGQIHFDNMGDFELKGLEGIHTLYWAIDNNSPRRYYVQQFELGNQFRESSSMLTLPIYIEPCDKERVDLRQALTKCLSNPSQISSEEKSSLLQRLILWTNQSDEKIWLDFPIIGLIDFAIKLIREGVSSVSTHDDISIDMSSK